MLSASLWGCSLLCCFVCRWDGGPSLGRWKFREEWCHSWQEGTQGHLWIMGMVPVFPRHAEGGGDTKQQENVLLFLPWSLFLQRGHGKAGFHGKPGVLWLV